MGEAKKKSIQYMLIFQYIDIAVFSLDLRVLTVFVRHMSVVDTLERKLL